MRSMILALTLLAANSAFALTPEFNAYMRASTGGNSHGGAMECYNNKGAAAGNEFRLANECGIYGEFLFGAQILKAEGEHSPFWRLGSNFAFVYRNSNDFETTSSTNVPGDNPTNWVIRELYTEGGNIDDMHFSVWAGKRFYRWAGMHMDDFFPIEMSGPGAGIGDLKSSWGTWSFAVIQNTESTEFPGRDTPVATDIGRAAKTSLNLRLEAIETSVGTFAVWLANGSTAGTAAKIGATPYKRSSGNLLGLKHTYKFSDQVSNDLGVAYGTGVMSNMTARGELVKDCSNTLDADCTVSKANRVRVWDGTTWNTDRWSGEVALIYDQFNSGADQNSTVKWTSIGARPMYWFTDHLSLAVEAGASNVIDDGNGLGSRNMLRTTIAPQISIGKGYGSRPVIRAFYTRTTWNDQNKISFQSTTSATDTQSQNLGVQTEVWF